ncbi:MULTISPECIES: phage virion morphogenesis protein [unclassified Pseudomonas]|uniref:phage virion morphogenesis protein n=1 Tax=unclassified Pseudomonas TaxID=196821 RepID=UPI000C86B823|nr:MULTISPECIES: phage virion morphogenesis protein [unclassified Pseudomonas]PMV27272.1 phage virion morphogenesis protein [Pseudomonas sp. FW305-3-2-15-C-TSA2]PMV32527.1 phage virion morphogenesis protein [Pseudomonas sp. DP16D-L5]PMV42241.1 phage virion morphogenesis protein [Pseudomonas sp. FW305-3-2-15-A-LB2]PMV49719.1 phage virion morphogenesis protein [Pseudomonas sp. FW305-3-2-15-C-R2A1]PMV55165.1 phage virion morphogenesis protein [Pseudomonas sp. FW305-3-2-15-C-LB1]
MTAPTLSFDIRGLIEAEQRLQLLALPAGKRRRLLNNASKRLRTRNTRRIGTQRNLDGSPFAPRKQKSRRKMLRRLSTRLQVTKLSPDAATLGWRQRRNARIALKHQLGLPTTVTSKRRSWKIDLPARDTLGADPQDIREILRTVLQQTLHSPK